ncbi:hypothetical protein LTR17_005390 [Elasticomyces elasticus]|nr:hypothetical protein LTR17_005390 [Elasticomyces elasticus]
MAEVAGLIVGGLGLAALFDSCLQAFEHVEAAKNYGAQYQRLMLRLSILQLRLARWGATVRLVDGESEQLSSYGFSVSSQAEAETVRRLLGEIFGSLEDARTASQPYTPAPTLVDNRFVATNRATASITAMMQMTRTLARRRQKQSTTLQKARWALHDESKLRRLVQDLTGLIADLVELFPATQSAQKELALVDAVELVRWPYAADANTESAESQVNLLVESASAVDPLLDRAVSDAAKNDHRHAFNKVEAIGDARVHDGDFVSEGASVVGYGHDYNGVLVSGRARMLNGNRYGGKSVLDD